MITTEEHNACALWKENSILRPNIDSTMSAPLADSGKIQEALPRIFTTISLTAAPLELLTVLGF